MGNAGSSIGNAFTSFGDAVANAAKNTGDGVVDAGRAVGTAGAALGDGINSVIHPGDNNDGGSGSTIGDLFYPGNPERRDRAKQLQDDCNDIINLFTTEKAQVDALKPAIKQKMMDFLKSHGYSSLDQLIEHVNGVLKGDALADWDKLKQQLGKGSTIENAILTLTGVIAALTGIVTGGLMVFGVVSGPVGWGVIGGVSLVAGIIAGVTVVFAVVEAKEEKDKLNEAISKLAFARVEVKQQLDRVQVYKQWLALFDDIFSSRTFGNDPNAFNDEFGDRLKKDMQNTERPTVIKELAELDSSRKAKTQYDPDVTNAQAQLDSAGADGAQADGVNSLPPEVVLRIHFKADPKPEDMQMKFLGNETMTDATALDVNSNQKWHIHANTYAAPGVNHDLRNVDFTVTNLDTGVTKENCTIEWLGLIKATTAA